MRGENFPSSVESVDALLDIARSGTKLDGQQRKALRDYLAGSVSSNTLKPETSKKIGEIRKILGYRDYSHEAPDSTVESEAKTWEEIETGNLEETENRPKRWDATINGVAITVNRPYADPNRAYEIYFPQAVMKGPERVPDQVLVAGDSESDAKKVFDKACELAKAYDSATYPKIDKGRVANELIRQLEKYISAEIYGDKE